MKFRWFDAVKFFEINKEKDLVLNSIYSYSIQVNCNYLYADR